MSELPEFLRPLTDEGSNVIPFQPARRISDPVARARHTTLVEIGIDAEDIVRGILNATRLLQKGEEVVMDHNGQQLMIPLSRERIAGLSKTSDNFFRLLNKVMPDMKQVETETQRAEQVFNLKMIMNNLDT